MIKQGDIVASLGRIETIQDGHKRYIEFTAAHVLEVSGVQITVNPVGKKAILICHADDLLGGDAPPQAPEQPETVGLPQTTASRESAAEVAEEAKEPVAAPEPQLQLQPEKPKPKPSGPLASLAKKPAAKPKPAATKPPAKKAPARKPAARRRKS